MHDEQRVIAHFLDSSRVFFEYPVNLSFQRSSDGLNATFSKHAKACAFQYSHVTIAMDT